MLKWLVKFEHGTILFNIMVHYFNDEYEGQTPEIFKANLFKYLLTQNVVNNLDEFYGAIKNTKLASSGFNLKLKGELHEFRSYSGGVRFEENCPSNCYIITEQQHLWVLSPFDTKPKL